MKVIYTFVIIVMSRKTPSIRVCSREVIVFHIMAEHHNALLSRQTISYFLTGGSAIILVPLVCVDELTCVRRQADILIKNLVRWNTQEEALFYIQVPNKFDKYFLIFDFKEIKLSSFSMQILMFIKRKVYFIYQLKGNKKINIYLKNLKTNNFKPTFESILSF